MDHKALRDHERRILAGLVKFYLERGHTSSTYMDPEKGGLYENKLAAMLGYTVTSENLPPPEFIAAAQSLEDQGYVRRIRRVPGQALLGIWPTYVGIKRAEFLEAAWFRWVGLVTRDNAVPIAVSVITTLITLAVAAFFKLFGLGE